ncbi:HD domain-containing protein [Burkholderia sp. MBR-1]|uniref:HD domain-containing protein n=1 Tax=Burkholderia sp. MBR-1 TaxID=2732364 RepID=UPI001C670756|nr:HD domain-containing protein [Burkholderia sp. MBR-1]
MSAAVGATCFWLVVLTGVGIWHGSVRVTDLFQWSFYFDTVKWPIAGGVSGFLIACLSIHLDRRYRFEELAPHSQAGLTTKLGIVPIHLEELESAGERIAPAALASVARLANIITKKPKPPVEFLDEWYLRFEKPFPKHTALMRKLEGVFMSYRHYPASHVVQGSRNHGGRSLLEHSVLVALLMEWNAPSFEYPIDRSKPHLPLLDQNYRFNSHDPVIALAGMAHDIGKIECYQFEEDDPEHLGAPIGSRPDHDRTGARCLARMPEFWDLPADDRDVLRLVVAHYHAPQEMPMATPKQVLSDRLHAILELLIKWDTEGSALENREGAREAEHDKNAMATEPQAFKPQSQLGQRLKLWEVCQSVMNEAGRINGADKRRNVGWKYHFPHLGKTLVFLVEDAFVKLVAARANLEDEMGGTFSGSSVDPLTKKILMTFFEQGVLHLDFQDARLRSPDLLAYVARMWEPRAYFESTRTKRDVKPVGKRGKPTITLGSVLVLEITDATFPELMKLPDNNLVPEIKHFRLGAAGRGRKPKAGAPAPTGDAAPQPVEPTDSGWYVPDEGDRLKPGETAAPKTEAPTDGSGENVSDDPADPSGQPLVSTPTPQGEPASVVPQEKVAGDATGSKAISSGLLYQMAKRALEQGEIEARLIGSSKSIIVYTGQKEIYGPLGLIAFGYDNEQQFIVDAASGRIREVTAGELEGRMIVRIAPSAESLRAMEG